MSRRLDQRDRIAHALAGHVLRAGLSKTSLRQLADAAGVSDRMLLYYFRNKSDVLTTVLMRIAADLAARLDAALPEDEAFAPADMFARAADLTGGRALSPYMRLWMEIAAAAGRDDKLYADAAEAIAAGFLVWIEKRLSTPDAAARKAQAAMIFAMLDGLAILSACVKKSVSKLALKEMTAALSRQG